MPTQLIAQMAKGYWNVSGAINNPEGMGPYPQAVEPYLAKFNTRLLHSDISVSIIEEDDHAGN